MSTPDKKQPTVFSKAAADRITKAVSRSELLPFDPRTPMRRRYPVGTDNGSMIPVKSGGSGISAGSMASPASATCTMCKWNGTGIETNDRTVTVYNKWSTGVPANVIMDCYWWAGKLWVASYDCTSGGGG
jgi:hypothetical protein